jgi:hypothetical protein
MPNDTQFKLVEIQGYSERDIMTGDSLEEIEEFVTLKTGTGRGD